MQRSEEIENIQEAKEKIGEMIEDVLLEPIEVAVDMRRSVLFEQGDWLNTSALGAVSRSFLEEAMMGVIDPARKRVKVNGEVIREHYEEEWFEKRHCFKADEKMQTFSIRLRTGGETITYKISPHVVPKESKDCTIYGSFPGSASSAVKKHQARNTLIRSKVIPLVLVVLVEPEGSLAGLYLTEIGQVDVLGRVAEWSSVHCVCEAVSSKGAPWLRQGALIPETDQLEAIKLLAESKGVKNNKQLGSIAEQKEQENGNQEP